MMNTFQYPFHFQTRNKAAVACIALSLSPDPGLTNADSLSDKAGEA